MIEPASVCYLEGPLGAGKTARLIDKASQLLARVPSTSVLVLCATAPRQRAFQIRLASQLAAPLGQWPIYTYQGFARNALLNAWPLVEARLGEAFKENAQWKPFLCGTQESVALARLTLTQLRQKQSEAFADFPTGEASLIRQLVRRIRLRAEYGLSRQQMAARSAWLGEPYQAETTAFDALFDRLSYQYRHLDTSKQSEVFLRMLEENQAFCQQVIGPLAHVLVDDVDETTPAAQRFLRKLAPDAQTWWLTADIDGGSRRGYLSAYPYDWPALKRLREGQTVPLQRTDTIATDATQLLSHWQTEPDAWQPLPCVTHHPVATYADMVDAVASHCAGLTTPLSAVAPEDIAIVLPDGDALHLAVMRQALARYGLDSEALVGTHHPLRNPLCSAGLSWLRFANPEWWPQCPDALALSHACHWLFGDGLPEGYIQALSTSRPNLPALELTDTHCQGHLEAFANWLGQVRDGMTLEAQLHALFEGCISRVLSHDLALAHPLADWSALIDSWQRHKELASLAGLSNPEAQWLAWMLDPIASNTPKDPAQLLPGKVLVGTPQKLIDAEARTAVQLWVDVGAQGWMRTDHAPLYSAWAHPGLMQPQPGVEPLEKPHELALTRARAAHISRTLMLLARERIVAFSSDEACTGQPLPVANGGLLPRLCVQAVPRTTVTLPFQLRADQQPVCEYRGGTMAVSAVPGAGKTFINVVLILTLIAEGWPAEQMVVVTFMESAARTMLSRLRRQLPPGSPLPMINTIHALAYRILSEDGVRLGYVPEDMRIVDELERISLLDAVARSHCPKHFRDDPDDWRLLIAKAIACFKEQQLSCKAVQRLSIPTQASGWAKLRLPHLAQAYQAYEDQLHGERGALDYTDLILLALRLLEENDDVRQNWQTRCRLVLEDEAQDSSPLQQRLLGLLAGGHGNLIRTGDINQAINTTFSAAEPEDFRRFIQQAERRVVMDQTSRAIPALLDLANGWLNTCVQAAELGQAFEPVTMLAMAGHAPDPLPQTVSPPVIVRQFATDADEQAAILDYLKAVLPHGRSAAVLVRTNGEVDAWYSRLAEVELPCFALRDTARTVPAFARIAGVLEALQTEKTSPEPAVFDDARWGTWRHQGMQAVAVADVEDMLCAMAEAIGKEEPTLRPQLYALVQWVRQQLPVNMPDPGEPVLSALGRLFAQHHNRAIKQLAQWEPDMSQPTVWVMTLHKAKGREFDSVVMPGLDEDSFAMRPEKIRLRKEDRLGLALEQWLSGEPIDEKNETAVAANKQAVMAETARLLYVGITRARRSLWLSYAKPSERVQPARLWQWACERYAALVHTTVELAL